MTAREVRADRRMWRIHSGYAMLVGIEGCFSTLKRIFGDELRSRDPCRAERGTRLKVVELQRHNRHGRVKRPHREEDAVAAWGARGWNI